MYTLERLEAALVARWGREEMTVYADYLQSIGDPRGEVIAIDLVNLDTVNEAAWRTRRHAALAAWLGEDLATKFGGQIFQGFVQEASSDDALLASPAGDFVRAARFSTTDRAIYERFASRPRPWLMHLSIAIPEAGIVLDDALSSALVAATPRLDELVLRGNNLARRLAHPMVRHVRVEGRAVGALGWRGDTIAPPGTTFAIERLRDNGGTRLYLGPASETGRILDDATVQAHVTQLRLAGADPRLLQRALRSLPHLALVEVTAVGRELDVLVAAAKNYPHATIESIDR